MSGLRLFIIIAFGVAACALEFTGLSIITNLATLAILAAIAAWGLRRGAGRGPDLPMPRWRGLEYCIPGIVAFAAVAPTFALPFLSDDYALYQGHGSIGSGWHVVFPEPDRMFYRPVGWLLWWALGHYQCSAAFARGIAILLFTVTAIAAAPALRRLGASRGVAVWSAIFFALHPHSLETVAWLANYYSLFSLFFALAAIITIPNGRASAGRLLASGIFASLSFLSKEEAILWLPVAAVAAVTRFRPERLRGAIRSIWPIAMVAFAAVAIRIPLLGGVGGYRVPETGNPIPIWRYRRGIVDSLFTEMPCWYFMPIRRALYSLSMTHLFVLSGLALPAMFLFTHARRGAGRACALFLILSPALVLPAASMLPSGWNLASARLLYSLSVFISFAVVAAMAAASLPKMVKITILCATAALMAWVGSQNFAAWVRCGRYVDDGLKIVLAELAKIKNPDPFHVAIVGFPDSVSGAYCFRNAVSPAIELNAHNWRLNVALGTQDLGSFDFVYYVNYQKMEATLLPDPRATRRLAPGESWTIPFDAKDESGLDLLQRLGVRAEDLGGQLRVHGAYQGSALLLPAVLCDPNSKLRVTWNGRSRNSRITIIATTRKDNRCVRNAYEENAWIPSGGGAVVSIELRIPQDANLEFSSLTIERAPE